jgi:hypothetical protein
VKALHVLFLVPLIIPALWGMLAILWKDATRKRLSWAQEGCAYPDDPCALEVVVEGLECDYCCRRSRRGGRR